jgi:hypothetical protein
MVAAIHVEVAILKEGDHMNDYNSTTADSNKKGISATDKAALTGFGVGLGAGIVFSMVHVANAFYHQAVVPVTIDNKPAIQISYVDNGRQVFRPDYFFVQPDGKYAPLGNVHDFLRNPNGSMTRKDISDKLQK